jgi:hypothetical protein
MSTSLQFRRGTTAQNTAFRGAPGELSVDTDLWQIRIHDGVNYGGHVIQGGSNLTQGVTSVAFSTGTTGLTVQNSPVTPTSNNPITLGGTRAKANGGTGVSNPSLIPGTNITITGDWPNQTITASSGTGAGNVTAGTNTTVTGTWPNIQVNVSGIISVANGGTGTANPNIQAGSGITVTGTWPNVTIAGTSTGARGGGTDKIFWENDKVITTNYTISTDKNAMTAGPVTVNTGITVIIPTGSSWSVV